MSSLSGLQHKMITESLLKSLHNNYIYDCVDFLSHDLEKLETMTKVSYFDLLSLKRHIIKTYKADAFKGKELLEKTINTLQFLKTGIERLDQVIEGLPIGKITEISGLSRSGKSQLAYTIVCNTVSILKYNVIYINTNEDFNSKRVYQILKENKFKNEDIETMMIRINVIKIKNMNELLQLFYELVRDEKLCKFVSLIVVDALPSLMLLHQGEDNYDSLTLLNQFVSVSRLVGNKYRISILVINLYSRWFEIDMNSNESRRKEVWVEKKVPLLGKFWQHIPSLYIVLEKKDCDNIEANIRKACSGCIKSVALNLNSKGVM